MEGNDPGVEIQIADCRWPFCNSIYIISIPHVMMGNLSIPTARANLEIKMHTMRIEKRHLIYIGVIFKVQRFSILEAYFYQYLKHISIYFWSYFEGGMVDLGEILIPIYHPSSQS